MLDHDRIGTHLSNLRKRRGLTQTALADHLGVTHQAISKWENGSSLPDLETLLRLAKLHACTVEQLLLVEPAACTEPAGVGAGQQDEPGDTTPSQWQDDIPSLWLAALESFRSSISGPSYVTWFGSTSAEFDGERFIIYSPTGFATDWLSARYTDMITRTLEQLTGEQSIAIQYRTRPNPYANQPSVLPLILP